MTHLPSEPAPVPAIAMMDLAFGAMHDPTTALVEGIDWTVNPGDYWVVAGLHGSGKSDFLMLAGGLMPPQHGHYRFFGEPMPIFEDARVKTRLRLGLVFEDGRLFNHLTVLENITLPLRYHEDLGQVQAASAVAELLACLELDHWANRLPGTLGRGWQKRVSLARALALKPEVLLVDNPLAGLDPRQIAWWLTFLDQLSKGHSLLQGRPVTLVVTAAAFHPWKGHARQFALLRDHSFQVVGDWGQLTGSGTELVRELLTPATRTE